MNLQFIRHATLWLDYAGLKFLIDPMFSDQEANPPIVNTANPRRNPIVPLPVPLAEIGQPDVIIVTHLHGDHWDGAAAEALPKSTPILCQPGDEGAFTAAGFTSVMAIQESFTLQGVTLYRTDGQHGTGEIGKLMGQVSGFVFKAENEPTLYLAGDTIWCDDVQQALETHLPDWTIVNAGGAQFEVGDPITMDTNDVVSLCRYAPFTKIVAVHMDAINHCHVTREDLRNRLAVEGLLEQVVIPEDGAWVTTFRN
ncbi:MBL fold metallo-hydrolase [Paenibacillus sp. LjRoot153]|uniref:MBL fold metallo-hydrolase n=1 Tax=Paenibacillus sp. LjRoot153 TaxID=3342270 RepID=UPI003ECD06D6